MHVTPSMHIVTISYGLTVNLGNYESARVDATAQVAEGAVVEHAMEELRAFVNKQAEEIRQARANDKPGWKS